MDVSQQNELLLPEIITLFNDNGFELDKGFEYTFTKKAPFGGIKLSLFFSDLGESNNSLYSISLKEVEEIMLDVGVPYNSWIKQKKGKKLLYTLYDGLNKYPFTRRMSVIGNCEDTDIKYIESEEDVLKWKEALIEYINGAGKLFVEEFRYLPNALRKLDHISQTENRSYTHFLLGRLDHHFRSLIISKLCDDPFFQKKLNQLSKEVEKDENSEWVSYFTRLESRLSKLQANYIYLET